MNTTFTTSTRRSISQTSQQEPIPQTLTSYFDFTSDFTSKDSSLDSTSDENSFEVIEIIKTISVIGKIISNKIRRAGIENLYGFTSITNLHGEEVKKLDIISNSLFINFLKKNKSIYALVSEEDVDPIFLNEDGKYVVAFDPLDGSSNIDCNVGVGSIFCIFTRSSIDNLLHKSKKNHHCLNIINSGYILYSGSTMMIVTTNAGVKGFTLDDNIGEFLLTHHINIPKGKIYSINEGNYYSWDSSMHNIISALKSNHYSSRYIGSMVADVHRTLLYGGIFMYPSSTKALNGKLRYLYEVAPLSHIIKVAGGNAILYYPSQDTNIGECVSSNYGNNANKTIINALDYIPQSIHDRVPIIMGDIENINMIKTIIDDH